MRTRLFFGGGCLLLGVVALAACGEHTDAAVASPTTTAGHRGTAPAAPTTASLAPVPPGAKQRAMAYVERVEISPEPAGSGMAVRVVGQLPTPCHQLKWSVGAVDVQGRISVDVFSEVDAAALCNQMVKPFDETIELPPLAAGSYQALVNGKAYPFKA